MPGMYDEWSVADHLKNIRITLKHMLDRGVTLIDLADALHQIELVHHNLGLPIEDE